jgi:small-conductance mechanosensitive channel
MSKSVQTQSTPVQAQAKAVATPTAPAAPLTAEELKAVEEYKAKEIAKISERVNDRIKRFEDNIRNKSSRQGKVMMLTLEIGLVKKEIKERKDKLKLIRSQVKELRKQVSERRKGVDVTAQAKAEVQKVAKVA